MTYQVIPEAAVEAAAFGIYQVVQATHAKERGWDEMPPAWQEAFRIEARAALEAAAPHNPRPTPTNQQRKKAMMISEEAVGAALYARSTFKNQRGRDNEANLMRAILEAAAPHMLADAWDEGYEKGALSQFEEPRNPYRPTP